MCSNVHYLCMAQYVRAQASERFDKRPRNNSKRRQMEPSMAIEGCERAYALLYSEMHDE